ncbi:hypothetical protein ACOSQ3_008869 [Xanthoceras sorbifolium]
MKDFICNSGRWCMANPIIDTKTLNAVIEAVCSKADCSPIKKGGSCFLPNDPYNHASFAVDLYYQNSGRAPEICEGMFGLRTDKDPTTIMGCRQLFSMRINCGSCTSFYALLLNIPPQSKHGAINDEFGRWCMANPTISTELLNAVITVICSKADCSPIKEGGSCFLPDDPYNHASFVLDLYYQNSSRDPEICERFFGLKTDQDPSTTNLFIIDIKYVFLFKFLGKFYSNIEY